MWSVSFKPPVLAGIAILPGTIHLIQMMKTRKSYQVERVRCYPLATEIFSEGRITGFAGLQKMLMEMVRHEGLEGARASLCLPVNQVRMQRMKLPSGLSDRDIAAEISIHVHRSLPVKPEDLALDYQIYPAATTDEMEVFYAAARKNYIEQLQLCCEASGLLPVMMDVDVFALLRSIRYALDGLLPKEEVICVLYCMEEYALMAAVKNEEIIFCQQWNGDGVMHAMTRMQWLNWCCQTWCHISVHSAVIGGMHAYVYEAAAILATEWRCKIFQPDPFAGMRVMTGKDKSIIHECPSAFLLACGLAMRSLQPW